MHFTKSLAERKTVKAVLRKCLEIVWRKSVREKAENKRRDAE